ncbi:Hypothetical protein SMAX5B_016986 [Scophthalmus maximus]|uniref:Uncharacterized protein n=1 Tax=Scophthalmus maximus TaxID=52904 RepID=A0A2U9B9S8_SCOMX|nr:Hypothetical protein SMAX5B_016986 [Scophthalmus maximus]
MEVRPDEHAIIRSSRPGSAGLGVQAWSWDSVAFISIANDTAHDFGNYTVHVQRRGTLIRLATGSLCLMCGSGFQ